MRNPVAHVPRPLKLARWTKFIKNVPGINPEVLKYVYPGPGMEFDINLPQMNTSKYRIFQLGEAVSVLKCLVDHWILQRFAGPFPHWVSHLNGESMEFQPMFCIPKDGSSVVNPKNRVLLNCAATHPLPFTKEQIDFVSNFAHIVSLMQLCDLHDPQNYNQFCYP